ncbi:MAG: hypothetical protein ACOCV2_12835 [Persicimonas sp.]
MKYMIAAIAVGAVLWTGCWTNECRFTERCEGDVRQVCGSGPDHIVGRKVNDFPCEDPNPECIEYEERSATKAMCVRGRQIQCDSDAFEESCDGDTAIRCVEGYEVAEDCSQHGPDCEVVDGHAICVDAPATRCDGDFERRCEGAELVRCSGTDAGPYVTRRDCTKTGATCETSTFDGAETSYCEADRQ